MRLCPEKKSGLNFRRRLRTDYRRLMLIINKQTVFTVQIFAKRCCDVSTIDIPFEKYTRKYKVTGQKTTRD